MAIDEKAQLLDEKYRNEERGGHHQYPRSLASTTTSSDLEFYNERLSAMSGVLFCEEADTEVKIIEVPESSSPNLRKLTSTYELECYIAKTPVSKSRVISICSPSPIEPLNITETSMRDLLDKYKIGTEFLDLLFSLGNNVKDSEAGLGKMVTREMPGGVYDTSYLYTYPASSKQEKETFWSFHRTAVFHRFDAGAKSHLWVLLHPQHNTVIEQRLLEAVRDRTWGENSSINWDQLHLLILSSYTKNWGSYLNHLEASIKQDAKPGLVANVCALEKLQHLQDELVPLNARLNTSLGTVRVLGNLNTLYWQKKQYDEVRFKGISFELGYAKHELEEFLAGIETMKERLKGAIQLRFATFNHQNQITSTQANVSSPQEENPIIRFITIIILIFLPPIFVAAFFSTNFFTISPDGDQNQALHVSMQLWLYFAVAVPLSMLCLGSWYLCVERPRNRRVASAKRWRETESMGETAV